MNRLKVCPHWRTRKSKQCLKFWYFHRLAASSKDLFWTSLVTLSRSLSAWKIQKVQNTIMRFFSGHDTKLVNFHQLQNNYWFPVNNRNVPFNSNIFYIHKLILIVILFYSTGILTLITEWFGQLVQNICLELFPLPLSLKLFLLFFAP